MTASLLSLPELTAAATVAPVHLAEMHRVLRITDDEADRDAEIRGYIEDATEQLEADTLRQFVAASFTLKMGCFPRCDIVIPRVPVLSVASVTYFDTDNDSQTVSAADYFVHKERIPPRIELDSNDGSYWPAEYDRHDAVTVNFTAGHAVPLSVDDDNDELTSTGHTFTNGDSFRLSNSGGTLPAGLSSNVTYYVVGASGNTFGLSLTSGGAAVAIGSEGSGQLFAGTVPHLARRAIMLLAKGWYCGDCALGCTNESYEMLMHRLRWEVVC